MYQIFNEVENKIIFESSNDLEFIKFVEKLTIENEDFQYSVLGVSDAIEYIEDYCGNLSLI